MKKIFLPNTSFTGFLVERADVSAFKEMIGNRPTSKHHVLSIRRSMNKRQLFAPIYVNDGFEVIDGQHRLEAIKGLEPPTLVEYIRFSGENYDKKVIPLYNTNTTNWTSWDHIHSQSKQGNQNAQMVEKLMVVAPLLAAGAAFSLLSGIGKLSYIKVGASTNIDITQEDFDNAVVMYKQLEDFKNKGFKYWKSGPFVVAFRKLQEKMPKYNHARMKSALDRIKLENKLLQKRTRTADYLDNLTKLYFS